MFEIARNNINKIAFWEKILETASAGRDTVSIDILTTSRNSDRKIMQLIRITSGPPTRIRSRNISPGMTTVFHARPHSRFIEIQSNLRRQKLHRTNQSSIYLFIIISFILLKRRKVY